MTFALLSAIKAVTILEPLERIHGRSSNSGFAIRLLLLFGFTWPLNTKEKHHSEPV
jgi:hypothetical protein